MEGILQGRVAVVTGSGNGIGRAEAKAMAAQGAKVVVNDIGTSWDGKGSSHSPADLVVEAIKKAGGEAVASYDSVVTEKGAESIIQTAVRNFGRIDILVNNAGVVRDPPIDVSEITNDDWEILIKTHLYGTFYCTRYACGLMKKQRSGKIINTSSHVGLGWKGFAAYGAAKEGIVGFTRTVARDMAEHGVNCNAIRPLAAWRGTKAMTGRQSTLLPEDIAPLVVFLASEKANHVNGCIFEVWHGHVGIFQDPPPIEHSIDKADSWTVSELLTEVPERLTKNHVSQKFPEVLPLRPM